MTELTFEEFCNLSRRGESRNIPGRAVSYVLVENEDGEEVFYAEEKFEDEDREEEFLQEAYQDYLVG